MPLYTKTGDDGTTGLFGGERVNKDSLRIDACGTVDELNCVIGQAVAICQFDELAKTLQSIQNHLFELGAHLATPDNRSLKSPSQCPKISTEHVRKIERMIDQFDETLPPLRQFILPTGSELASRLHLARAVARRAERRCVTMASAESLEQEIVIYLNRISDLLFTLARCANQFQQIEDVPWKSLVD